MIGSVVALICGPLLGSLLIGVSPADPVSFGVAALVLLAVHRVRQLSAGAARVARRSQRRAAIGVGSPGSAGNHCTISAGSHNFSSDFRRSSALKVMSTGRRSQWGIDAGRPQGGIVGIDHDCTTILSVVLAGSLMTALTGGHSLAAEHRPRNVRDCR